MLRSMQLTNTELETEPVNDNLTVLSMDAEALFPSLALEDIMDGIWRLIMESNFKFSNVNYKQVAMYLAVMYMKEDLVKNKNVSCIPVRQVQLDGKVRCQPTLAYLDNPKYTRVVNDKELKGTDKWVWDNVKEPSDQQKRRMLAMMIQSAT